MLYVILITKIVITLRRANYYPWLLIVPAKTVTVCVFVFLCCHRIIILIVLSFKSAVSVSIEWNFIKLPNSEKSVINHIIDYISLCGDWFDTPITNLCVSRTTKDRYKQKSEKWFTIFKSLARQLNFAAERIV